VDVGSNPGTVYLIVVSDARYYNWQLKNHENKGSQMGHTKKYFFKDRIIYKPYL
jgi:hypothetical protein